MLAVRHCLLVLVACPCSAHVPITRLDIMVYIVYIIVFLIGHNRSKICAEYKSIIIVTNNYL